MPNIQICGFFLQIEPAGGGIRIKIDDAVFILREKIDQVMQDMGLGNDAITDIIPSISVLCDGSKNRMHYIRICDTNLKRMERIVQALKAADIGMDVETLLLSGSVEAKDMKS